MKKPILIYDLASVPEHIDIEKIMYIFKQQRCVFYDSKGRDGEGAETPQVVSITPELEDIEVEFLDVSKEENLKKLNGYKKRIR